MHLREQIYQAVDGLDDVSLSIAFAYISALPQRQSDGKKMGPERMSWAELDKLTASDTADWSRLFEEEREDRV